MRPAEKYAECGSKRQRIAGIAAPWFTRLCSSEKTPVGNRQFRTCLTANESRPAVCVNLAGKVTRIIAVTAAAVLMLTVTDDTTAAAPGMEFNVSGKNEDGAMTGDESRTDVVLSRQQTDGHSIREHEPGEAVSSGPGGLGGAREVKIARAISWRKGRMVVTDEPLLNVIDEMNRHSKRKLKVDRSDPRLRKLLVTGQFRTGRPELIVEYLRAAGIRVWVKRDREGNITLRLRGERSRG